MSTFQNKSKAKATGKSTGTVHRDSTNSSTHNRGMSPASAGPLSAIHSAGPILSLNPLIQPKLTIGKPNDRHEREADQVMRMPEGSLVNSHWSLGKNGNDTVQTKPIADQIIPLVQRQIGPEEEEEKIEPGEAVQGQFIQKQEEEQEEDKEEPVQEMAIQRQEEEEEEEEEPVSDMSLQRQEIKPEEEEEKEPVNLQAKANIGSSPEVTPAVASGIRSLKGGGQPLPKSVRSYFEPRFGIDFSQVRVHTDSKAAKTAKSINAKAFTTGKDMVFGSGQYSPGTSTGKRLIAHELTHVIQQDTVNKTVTQLSPLSDELKDIWFYGDEEDFFDKLRNLRVSDPDVNKFVELELRGDDLWLAREIMLYGPEWGWPPYLIVELEMTKWGNGTQGVFDYLRDLHGSMAGDSELTNSIKRVFAAGTEERWFAQVLQALGHETFWPWHLRVVWYGIQHGVIEVPPMEVSGAELPFRDIEEMGPFSQILEKALQVIYNCYEYALGESGHFRQPGIGGWVPYEYKSRAGLLHLMEDTPSMGPVEYCDPACPSSTRKIMMFATDDVTFEHPIFRYISRIEVGPGYVIFWKWDFHFYRQDIGGMWSHKPGRTPYRQTDSGDTLITDPRTANRRSLKYISILPGGRYLFIGRDYRHLIGCWCVPRGTR